MKIYDERQAIQEAIAFWLDRYDLRGPRGHLFSSTTAKIQTLDPETVTAEELNQIFGNNYWTQPEECRECGEIAWNTIEFHNPDKNNRTWICGDCLQKALELLEEPCTK